MKAQRVSGGIALPLHDLGTYLGGGWLATRPGRFTPEKNGSHCTEGWVGLRDGLDGCGKYRLSPGFDSWPVQVIASRYTDWAVPPLTFLKYTSYNSSERRRRCDIHYCSSLFIINVYYLTELPVTMKGTHCKVRDQRTGLYCTELCWTVLYCTVLYCTVLYWTLLFCTIPYCIKLWCTVPYCTIL